MERALRNSGRVCAWAGALGVASGLLLIVAPKAVDEARFSYPLTSNQFAVIQGWFFVHHLLLAVGLIGLARTDASGDGVLARVGHRLAVGGMVLLAATEAWAITAADAVYPSSATDPLDALYGISSTAIGVGLVVVGVAVLRHGRWVDWTKWVPLALGVYVFVPMFPAMFGPFVVARLGISGWMLLFVPLGIALQHHAGEPRRTPQVLLAGN